MSDRITYYLDAGGPNWVKITSVIATDIAIFSDYETGTIESIHWLGPTAGHTFELQNLDGRPIFKHKTGPVATISPVFLNINLTFSRGLKCVDLDSGEVWLQLRVLAPKPSEMKI
jgi:hypothetical protein